MIVSQLSGYLLVSCLVHVRSVDHVFCFFVQSEAENDALSVMNPYIQDAFKKSGKTGVCTSCTVGMMGFLLLLTNKNMYRTVTLTVPPQRVLPASIDNGPLGQKARYRRF